MRRALYLGHFDPPTVVHDDIVARASQLFDELIVGVWTAPLARALLSFEQRLAMATALWASEVVRVQPATGDAATMLAATDANIELVHLRGIGDWERLSGNAAHERAYLLVEAAHLPITSALVREIVRLRGNVADFIPSLVQEQL